MAALFYPCAFASTRTHVRMYGRLLESGAPHALDITGFRPSIFLQIHPAWPLRAVERFVCEAARSCTVEELVACDTSGFTPAPYRWAKISARSTYDLKQVRDALDDRFLRLDPSLVRRGPDYAIPDSLRLLPPTQPGFRVCGEQDTPLLQMFTERGVRPSTWIPLPYAGCESMHAGDLRPLPPDVPVPNVVPRLVVASFDIETYASHATGARYADVKVPQDQIACIGVNIVGLLADGGMKWLVRTLLYCPTPELTAPWTLAPEDRRAHAAVLALDPNAPDLTLCRCDTNADMIAAFQALLAEHHADVITGYNILNYDLGWLWKRGTQACEALARDDGTGCTARMIERGYGAVFDIPGRIILDMYTYVTDNYKLQVVDYSLKTIAAYYLGDANISKVDLSYAEIDAILHANDGAAGGRVGYYCDIDTLLPILLMRHLAALVSTMELAAISRVPMTDILNRGQQIRVFSLLYAAAREKGYVVSRPLAAARTDERRGKKRGKAAFAGGHVEEPVRGLHTAPVVVFDFASLYPSIMITHNLCMTTILNGDGAHEHVFSRVISGKLERFVTAQTKRGLIPEILRALVAARKAVRALIPSAKTEGERMVLEQRQQAIKVTCNATYGFFGVGKDSGAMMPCQGISAMVTAIGRELIQRVGRLLHDWAGAQVVYGDTASTAREVV